MGTYTHQHTFMIMYPRIFCTFYTFAGMGRKPLLNIYRIHQKMGDFPFNWSKCHHLNKSLNLSDLFLWVTQPIIDHDKKQRGFFTLNHHVWIADHRDAVWFKDIISGLSFLLIQNLGSPNHQKDNYLSRNSYINQFDNQMMYSYRTPRYIDYTIFQSDMFSN